MDKNMERRGRIPVATFRTPDGKTRSRSRVRDPNYNKSDPETDLFTLLEDNIALREENESLLAKSTSSSQEKATVEKENSDLKNRIKELQNQHKSTQSQLQDVKQTLAKVSEENKSTKASQQENIIRVKQLTAQLEQLQNTQKDYAQVIATNKNFKEQIDKLIPTVNANEFESLIETEKDTTSNFIAIECIQKLLTEFAQLKTSLNNTELQLYEANEKISELLENQTLLEEENENLRMENTNLTKVAEMMTTNMKESVTTSKKMEEALIEMKRRNDELTRRSLDSTDGQTGKITVNDEIVRLREEITKRDLAHGERIVEMKKLMDTTIANSSNEEIKILRLKLELLETDLNDAIERAQRAETELEQIKRSSLYQSALDAGTQNTSSQVPTAPPPPPPPLPDFKFQGSGPNPTATNVRSLNDSITSRNLRTSHSNDGKGTGDTGHGGRSTSHSIGGSTNSLLRKQQVEATDPKNCVLQ